MKIMKTRKTDDEVKAMASFGSFPAIEDALAFEKAALAAPCQGHRNSHHDA